MNGCECQIGPGVGGLVSERDFRQLRHHTKNLLQRILLQIEQTRDLKLTASGPRLLADLQRRIVVSARISDALFGTSVAPVPMSERLRMLSESTIHMFADGTQIIRLDVSVTGECPEPLQQVVLRVAHEFIANAVKHGMQARLVGAIAVHLTTGPDGGTTLAVIDDGWGFRDDADTGGGLRIADDLAADADGTIRLLRTHETVAELVLPPPLMPRGFWNDGTQPGLATATPQGRDR